MPTDSYTSAARSTAAPDVAAPPTHLDQRQQVDRVERMADDEAFADAACPSCSSDGQQARGGRREHDVRSGRARSPRRSTSCLRSSRSGALSWTKSTPAAASSAEPTNGERALRRQRGHRQACRAARRALSSDLADLARRLGVGVEQQDVDAVEQEAGRPAATDDTATEQADARPGRGSGSSAHPLEPCSSLTASLSLSRTSCGPMTLHVHPSRIGDGPARRGRHWWPAGPRPRVQVVLQPDAHVAAGQRGHRDERDLHAADRERREHRSPAAAG